MATTKKNQTKSKAEVIRPLLAESGAEFKKLILCMGQMMYKHIECNVIFEQLEGIIDQHGDDLPEEMLELLHEHGIHSSEDIDTQKNYSEAMDMFQTMILLLAHEYRALVENKKMKKICADTIHADPQMGELKKLYVERMSEMSQVMVESGLEMEEGEDGKLIPKSFKDWDYEEGDEYLKKQVSYQAKHKLKSDFDDYMSKFTGGKDKGKE